MLQSEHGNFLYLKLFRIVTYNLAEQVENMDLGVTWICSG